MRTTVLVAIGALLVAMLVLIGGSADSEAWFEPATESTGDEGSQAAGTSGARPLIASSPHVYVPNLDGLVEETEWADAASYDISSAFFTAALYLKNDDDYLYLAVQAPSDTSWDDSMDTGWDRLDLHFDAGDDGSLLTDWQVGVGAADVVSGVVGPLSMGRACMSMLPITRNLAAIGSLRGYLEYELKIPLWMDEPGWDEPLVGEAGSGIGFRLFLGDGCLIGGCPKGVAWPLTSTIPPWYFECDDHETCVDTWGRIQLAGENPDPNEPNDSFLAATDFEPGPTVAAYVCGYGDEDYYVFTATQGTSVTLDLVSGLGDLLPADYELALYDASYVQVDRSETPGSAGEHIGYRAPSDGVLYARVWGAGGAHDCVQYYYLTVNLYPEVASAELGVSSPYLLYGDSLYVYGTVFGGIGNRLGGRTDVSVTIGTDALTLYDDGTHGDLGSSDGTYAAWYSDTITGTHPISLYVGGAVLDSHSFTVPGTKEAGLLVLTDFEELYDEFLETGTSAGEDNDGDGIIDFYQLLDRLHAYALGNSAIVYDLSQQISEYSAHTALYDSYQASRKALGVKIDQFIHDVVEETKSSAGYSVGSIALVGDPQVVPHYLVSDSKTLEGDYFVDRAWRLQHPNLFDSADGWIMSDQPYATVTTTVPGDGDTFPVPDMVVARVFAAHPDELIDAINKYSQPISLTKAAIFAQNPVCWTKESPWRWWNSDWLQKQGGGCIDANFPATAQHVEWQLDDYLSASNITSRTGDPYSNGGATDAWTYLDYRTELGRSDLTYILAHSEHTGQEDANAGNNAGIDKSDYTNQPVTTTNKLVVNAGCHGGYGAARVGVQQTPYDDQMVLGAMQRGITYIGSTVFTVFTKSHIKYPSLEFEGDFWTERWLNLVSQQLNTASSVGEAFRASIEEYGNQCGDFDKTDEHNIYGLILYGLPGQSVLTTASGSTAEVSRVAEAGRIQPADQLAPGSQSLQLAVDVAEVYTTGTGSGETLFTAFGAGYSADNGRPVVLQQVVVRAFPASYDVLDVQLTSVSSTTLPGTYQPLIAEAMTGEGQPIEPDFEATGLFPEEPYAWTVRKAHDETKLVLRVYPVQWDLGSGAVSLFDDFLFSVEISGAPPAGPIEVLDSGVGEGIFAVGEGIPVSVTVRAASATEAQLDVRLLDPGGNLRGRHAESLALAAGTSTVDYNLPTGRSQAGPRAVQVQVRDPSTGHLLYSQRHPVQLTSLVLSAWLDQGHYSVEATEAELRAQVRNESGAPATGLGVGFTLALDGEAVSPSFSEVASGSYTGALSLEGLDEGYHSLALSCENEHGSSNVARVRFLYGEPARLVYLPVVLRGS
jgi:hypothetical protein